MPVLEKPFSWRRSDARAARRAELTAEEQENVRKALRVLRTRHGGQKALAMALGVGVASLMWAMAKRGKPGAALALYAARLAKVPVEDVLAGRFPAEGACPMCGRVQDAP